LLFNENDGKLKQSIAKQMNDEMKVKTTEDERQRGKKGRHAAHYDMGKHEAGIQLGVPEVVAGKFLDMIHRTNPNIKGVFHKEIQDFLNQNNRILTNPFGRVRQFLNKWGDDLFKEAYAQIPQSTVSDQVKFAMIRIERRAPWLEILEESHDSFLSQCPFVRRAISV
jgi:DNA polymerase I-like protein with 3'-5' exonuclease and polymerase domains